MSGEPQAEADRVCHQEQLEVWSQEFVAALGMADFLKDPLDYDDNIELHNLLSREIKRLVERAFEHPERLRAPADEALVRQVATAITYVHGTAMDKARAALAEVVPAIRAAAFEEAAKLIERGKEYDGSDLTDTLERLQYAHEWMRNQQRDRLASAVRKLGGEGG